MKPGEHQTVQARILEYARAIGWKYVSREEAEQRRGFDLEVPPADRAKNRSLFFDDLLDAKVREFNPRYAEAEGALLGQFRHLHTDIYGNREFVEHLRNRGKFFDHEEKRERGLVWHTQGSGKTFTMIKAAERLFRAPEADEPTVLLLIDRNELEDQMLKNLAVLGLGNLEHARCSGRANARL